MLVKSGKSEKEAHETLKVFFLSSFVHQIHFSSVLFSSMPIPHPCPLTLPFSPKGTLSKDKNELLFQQFQMNYNNEPVMFRKGSCVYHQKVFSYCFLRTISPETFVPYAVAVILI
jgi:hypothetical protein